MSGFYEQARNQSQAEYEKAYSEWIAGLDEDERQRIESLGLSEPDKDIPQINGKGRSIEDLHFLAEEKEERDTDEIGRERVAEALFRAFVEVATAKNTNLMLDAFLSALGFYDYEGKTTEDLAIANGCSKQRFSFVRNQIIDQYNLRPPRTSRTRQQRTKRRRNGFTAAA